MNETQLAHILAESPGIGYSRISFHGGSYRDFRNPVAENKDTLPGSSGEFMINRVAKTNLSLVPSCRHQNFISLLLGTSFIYSSPVTEASIHPPSGDYDSPCPAEEGTSRAGVIPTDLMVCHFRPQVVKHRFPTTKSWPQDDTPFIIGNERAGLDSISFGGKLDQWKKEATQSVKVNDDDDSLLEGCVASDA